MGCGHRSIFSNQLKNIEGGTKRTLMCSSLARKNILDPVGILFAQSLQRTVNVLTCDGDESPSVWAKGTGWEKVLTAPHGF